MPRHERTLRMMENFISLHDEGQDIKDIAKKYDLSLSVVYKNLGEIARKAGVTRESLLQRVVIADHSGRNFTPVKPIDDTALQEKYDTVLTALRELRAEIANTIEEMEMMNELLEEEMR